MIRGDSSGGGFVSLLSKSSGKRKKENRFFVLLKGWRLKPPASLLCSLVTRKGERRSGFSREIVVNQLDILALVEPNRFRCTGLNINRLWTSTNWSELWL